MKENKKRSTQGFTEKLPLEKFIPAAFLIFLLCFVVLSIKTYNNIEVYRSTLSSVDHTNEVLKTADQIDLLLSNLHLQRRGYILKGEKRYLVEFGNSKTSLRILLDKLRSGSAVDEIRQEVNKLDSLSSICISLLDSSLSLFETEKKVLPEQTNLAILSQDLTDKAAEVTSRIKQDELKLLEARQTASRNSLMDTQLFIIFTSLFAFVVLGLSLFISRKLIRKKNEAESLLRKSYDELEDRVEERTNELKLTNESFKTEIENRIKIENSLRESEERFRILADSAPVLIWTSGKNKGFTYLSKGWTNFTGRSMNEELGNGWIEGVHHEDLQNCLDVYAAAFEDRTSFEVEFRLRSSAGEYKWFLNKGVPRYKANEFEGFVGICMDIHLKKRNERYLKIQYSVSKTLAEAVNTESALQNVLEDICTGVNWKFGIAWVADGEKLAQRALWSDLNPVLRDYAGVYDKTFSFKKGEGLPGRIWKDNKSYWVSDIEKDDNFPRKLEFLNLGLRSAFAIPISDNGVVTAVIECFNEDSHSPNEDLLEVLESVGRQVGNFLERKEAEESLKKAYDELEIRVNERTVELANTLNRLLDEMAIKEKVQNRLKLYGHALRGIKECVFITDLKSKTIFVNPSFESVYGYLESEILGQNIPVLYSGSITDEKRKEIISAALKSGWKGELVNSRSDGSLFYINLSASVIRDEEGRVDSIVGIVQDITEEKNTRALLEKRNSLLNLLNDVSMGSNKAESVKDYLHLTINKICEYTHWDIGHFLFHKDGVLSSSGIWLDKMAPEFDVFKAYSEELAMDSKNSIFEESLKERKPGWMKVSEMDPKSYNRADLMNKIALKACIWIPVISMNNVIGILEFFIKKETEPDKEIIDCLRNISIELGSYAERNDYLELILEREKHFKAIADTAHDAIVTADSDGKIIYVNSSVTDIFGYKTDDLIGKDLTFIMPEKYRKKHKESFGNNLRTGESKIIGRTIELSGRRSDGSEFPLELSLAKWEMDDRFYFTGMIRDISLRKQIESELIDKQKMLEDSQKIAKLGSWEWDPSTDSVIWSDEMFTIYGLKAGDFTPTFRGFMDCVHPEDAQKVKHILSQAVISKENFDFYHRIILPEGEIKILKAQGEVITDEKGKTLKVVGTGLDVTQVRQAEEKIIESEKKLKEAQRMAKLGSWEWDAVNDIVIWSEEMYNIFEVEQGTIISNDSYLALLDEDGKKQRARAIDEALKNSKPFNYYLKFITPSGKHKLLSSQGEIEKDGSGRILRMVGTVMDVTSIKEAEERIRESEKQLKEAQSIAKLGSWEIDLKQGTISWSDELFRIYEIEPGVESLDYDNMRKFIHQDDRVVMDELTKRMQEMPSNADLDYRIITHKGRLKYLSLDIRVENDSDGKPVRLYGSVQDITEIKLVEEELRKTNAKLIETQKELIHNEKLAALGRFSSGIAHEIRNPLANISALAQLVSKAKIEDEKMKKHLKYILVNTDIANKIIKDLLNFASPEEMVYDHISIKGMIESLINSVEARCVESKIAVSKNINKDLPEIRADKVKLENALLNFISNAIDAMPGGGNLSIRSFFDKVHQEIIIDVIDNGQGIPPENLDKIFEPFFTTKETGTGLGLGLAYQTIRSHHGILNIYSEPGKGTRVEIKLPVRNISENGKNSNNRR